MGIFIFLIIFVICIIAGFNGMPLMLIFPVGSIVILIIAIVNKNEFKVNGIDNKNSKINSKIRDSNSLKENDEDIDDFIIYDIINKK